jgi:hypothetical protein
VELGHRGRGGTIKKYPGKGRNPKPGIKYICFDYGQRCLRQGNQGRKLNTVVSTTVRLQDTSTATPTPFRLYPDIHYSEEKEKLNP